MNYENKTSDYYSNIRLDLVELIDKKDLKVLEIGAAYGATLFHLKNEGIANEVVGVELFKDSKNVDKYKNIDRFIFGDINSIDLSEFRNYFDLIMLPDVLEHILEPKKTLDKIKELLKPEGEVLVSMPNIRHYSAFIKIFIKGNFKYEKSGIFDFTHVRFYCKKDMKNLFESSGFKILYTKSSIRNYKGKSFAKIMNIITFKLFEEFFSPQYFFKLSKV